MFDLAGITCGHLLIPFAQFFTATFIGKAIIKAHLQAIVVIAVFGKEQLAGLINMIERLLPFLNGKLHAMLDAERSKLHRKFHGSADAPAAVRLRYARSVIFCSTFVFDFKFKSVDQ